MTDITELAQSEINDALAQLKQISEYPTPSTLYARVLRKYIATLVGALEKAQQRIAELESRLNSADKLQDSAFRSGLQHGFSLGQTDDQKGYEQSMAAYSSHAGIKVEAE